MTSPNDMPHTSNPDETPEASGMPVTDKPQEPPHSMDLNEWLEDMNRLSMLMEKDPEYRRKIEARLYHPR